MSVVTIPIHKFLGQPYKINVKIEDAGKKIGGTKKRIMWRLGWSQDANVHEITLLHSTFSGKKTIFENGIEIHCEGTSDLVDRGFEHSWKGNSGLNTYKLIGSYGFMKERDYELYINNIEYSLLPLKGPEHAHIVPKPIPIINTNNINNNKIQNNSNNKIATSNQSNGKKTSRSESFDPFAPSISPTSQFISNNSNTNNSKLKSSDPFSTNSSSTSPSFDSLEGKKLPTSRSRSESFDPFAPSISPTSQFISNKMNSNSTQSISNVETKQQIDPFSTSQLSSTSSPAAFTNFPQDSFDNFFPTQPSSTTSTKYDGIDSFQPNTSGTAIHIKDSFDSFQPISPISNVSSIKVSTVSTKKHESPNSITDNQDVENKIASSKPKIMGNESFSSMHSNNNINHIDDSFSNLSHNN
jgi:hypothetical protein